MLCYSRTHTYLRARDPVPLPQQQGGLGYASARIQVQGSGNPATRQPRGPPALLPTTTRARMRRARYSGTSPAGVVGMQPPRHHGIHSHQLLVEGLPTGVVHRGAVPVSGGHSLPYNTRHTDGRLCSRRTAVAWPSPSAALRHSCACGGGGEAQGRVQRQRGAQGLSSTPRLGRWRATARGSPRAAGTTRWRSYPSPSVTQK